MLTPRLEMILESITGKTVADIGTDHAFLAIELSERGKKVIATELSRGPLEAAMRNAKKFSSAIELRAGSGLEPLAVGEAEEIVIAGMGGELIERIISDSAEKARHSRLLLQPMNSQAELRLFLLENGFKIAAEELAAEGRRVYNLIIAEAGKGTPPEREIDLHLPPLLYTHPLFPMLIEKKEREFLKQYNGLSRKRYAEPDKLARLSGLLSDLNKIKGDVI